MTRRRRCKAKTRAGKPCKATPLKGKGFCSAHDPETPASARFGSRAQATQAGKQGGRPRLPTPSEVARRLIEQNELVLQRPYWRTLGYDVVLGPDGPYLVELVDAKGKPLGGAKLHGESKEGVVKVSKHDDLEAMQRAAERLQDRVYGRPKQVAEVTGANGGPLELVDVRRDRAKDVAALMARTGVRVPEDA